MPKRAMPVKSDDARSVSIGERLKEERERLGLSQPALIQGHPRSQVRYEKGERSPDANYLARVAEAGADVSYIVTGKRTAQSGIIGAAHRPGYVYLPLYEVGARAGKGGRVVDGAPASEPLAFREDWIRREMRMQPESLALCYVEGNSNVPDLHPGDIVMFNRADTTATGDGYYLIRLEGAPLIKRLQRLPEGVIKVSSKNPDYEPFNVKPTPHDGPNGFEVLGRIVWACRRM